MNRREGCIRGDRRGTNPRGPPRKSVSPCVRLPWYGIPIFLLIARKDIVHYTRLAAISQCFSVPRFPHRCRHTLRLPLFPRPVLPWVPHLVAWDNFPSALLLLEQFGQQRGEREEALTLNHSCLRPRDLPTCG